jgi:hypothetical protein
MVGEEPCQMKVLYRCPALLMDRKDISQVSYEYELWYSSSFRHYYSKKYYYYGCLKRKNHTAFVINFPSIVSC